MFQHIDQSIQKGRRKRSYRRYKCLLCGHTIAQRGLHLENDHDFDRFVLRELEGPAGETYFQKYFIETTDDLYCNTKKNYNPSLKKNVKFMADYHE